MTETAYLKEDLGPVLAKGLAAVSTARPEDPVEYLALWLKHYLQKRERKAAEMEAQRTLEAEREVWSKGRALREKTATAIIQREWRAHTKHIEDAKVREAALRQKFAQVEETADEQFPVDESLLENEGSEQEKGLMLERLRAQAQFGKAKLFVDELDKEYIAGIKQLSGTNKDSVLVVRCAFYLQNFRPRQLDSWDKLKNLLKPYPFLQWMQNFNPCAVPPAVLERKRKITRVRRLLQNVSDEGIKSENVALYAVFQWLSAVVAYREARDEYVKGKRALGRDVEEELDEEEELEDEEKDADEEVVKAAELELKRQQEAEAAAAAEDAEPVEEQ